MASRARWVAVVLVVALASGDTLPGQVISTRPPPGLREAPPAFHALVNAVVITAPGEKLEHGVVLVRDGRIIAVGESGKLAVPDGARVFDLSGKYVYPGLIDAYSESGESVRSTAKGYWNARVTPEYSVAAVMRPDRDAGKSLRGQGVVARLVAPGGRGIIKGTSAVVDTSDDSVILNPAAGQHVSLEPARRQGASAGAEEDRYPNSPMGAFTLVRQVLYDTQWYAKASASFAQHPALPKPPTDESLAVLNEQAAAKVPLIIDARDELYALRADRIGKEFNIPVIIRGNGQEYRLLAEIAKTGRPVLLPVAFPRAPMVGSPETAANASLMDLMSYDLSPENPARLDAAGVKFAFTSFGLSGLRGNPTLLGQIRKAVERGLTPDAALRALTTTPAALLNISDLGSIAVGKSASFVVTDGELFAEKTKVLETWVGGTRYELVPTPELDARGRWSLQAGTWNGTLSITGEDPAGRLKGELRTTRAPRPTSAPTTEPTDNDSSPDEVTATTAPATAPTSRPTTRTARGTDVTRLTLSDARLAFGVKGEALGGPAGAVSVSLTLINDTLTGTALLPDGTRIPVTGKRLSGPSTGPTTSTSRRTASATRATTGPSTRKALFEPNFPLGDYGQPTTPAPAPSRVLFKNATVWTNESDGILENASVLVESGKITSIFAGGALPKLPDDTTVIDCTGKHLTAGIIDAHSHMATDGGVNESGQTITAEVRIGDFIDPWDISIYRQLAGGVTSSNILHGSANTIGGQNQVIKLRWGAAPEQMKFEGAPPGIKFALGENPKQSNWGAEASGRYPQSRMGVEQLVRDAFAAARDYRAAHARYKSDPTSMLPPRHDLELEAIAEILEHKRWVHSHAYRQDEMLALLRTTADFGVTIGSFQHVLEGYKIADELAKAGVTASGFSDWWGFKVEVQDAIAYSPSIMWNQGVVVSLNSDDDELGRRLNLDAAKAVKYGSVPPTEAWKMVTLNPAKTLRIDDRVGSIKPGKDADLVVWSATPMSTFSKVEQTWVDGRCYFSLTADAALREENKKRHAQLIQRILTSGDEQAGPGDPSPTPAKLWPNHDEFCGHGHDDHRHETEK